MGRQSFRTIRSAALLTTALGLVVGWGATAQAKQATPQPADRVSQIEDVVVTARRSSERQQDVPIPVTTLGAQALADLSVRDVTDLQRAAPNLYITSSGVSGKARLYLRGQGEVDDKLTGDRSVGVYFNGVSNEHSYGLTAALVDIAQVEVLRGPQGTLFGRNTTGGALNITTNQPDYNGLSGDLSLLHGSYNKNQAIGAVTIPLIDDKLSVRLVGEGVLRDGYYNEANGSESGSEETVFGRLIVRADPAENVNILLQADATRIRTGAGHGVLAGNFLFPGTANYNAVTDQINSELGVPVTAANRASAYDRYLAIYNAFQADPRQGFSDVANPIDNIDQWGASSTITVDLNDYLTAKSITAFRHVERSVSTDLDLTPFRLVETVQNSDDDVFSQEFQLSAIDGAGFDWQAGAFYSRDTGSEFQGTTQVPNIPGAASYAIIATDVENVSKAVYAQGVYNFASHFRVTGGLRYTSDSKWINAHNRRDATGAIPARTGTPQPFSARCNLLAPAAGGPVYPDCNREARADFHKLTYLLSADWRPTDDLMLYATVTTGYRSGGFSQPASTSPIATAAAEAAAFVPYRPEVVTNYEIGVKSDWFSRRLRVNASLYSQDYEDIQVKFRNLSSGQLVNQINNAESATLYGGELEVIGEPIDRLIISGSLGYTHAEFDKFTAYDAAGVAFDASAQEFSVPKLTYNLSAAYEVPVAVGALRFFANYSWRDDVLFVPDFTPTTPVQESRRQPSYGLIDAKVSLHLDASNVEVSVFAKNLGDKVYYQNIAPTGLWDLGTLGDPRTYGLEVKLAF